MSRIDELIAEHCPDGVEFKRLGDIVRIKNGKDHKSLDDGDHPVYGSGGIMRYANAYAYDKPSVLIPRKGSLGNLFYVDVPFWNVDTIFYTEIDESQVLPKFLYFFLTTAGLGEMNQAGGVPSQTQSVLNELMIPTPHLEIQREIVKVLDTFTQLEAELEAELEARRRQYRYYRDALLSFDECTMGASKQARIRWATLGEIGTFIRGRRFTKADYADDGIPCIHYGEIYTRYGVSADAVVSYIDADISTKLRYAKTGDVVLTDVGETVEDVGKAVAWIGDEDVAIHDHCYAFRHSMNPKFVSYCMQTTSFVAEKAKYVARTKVNTLLIDGFSKIRIPIPPLDEQARIVAILDKFEALVNDISSGLPAEIQARRKQYEHYRDRLLSFKEAA
ncbi:restriction endonuclease subunit S [Pseudoxanthomonas mexicana]